MCIKNARRQRPCVGLCAAQKLKDYVFGHCGKTRHRQNVATPCKRKRRSLNEEKSLSAQSPAVFSVEVEKECLNLFVFVAEDVLGLSVDFNHALE